MKQIGTVKFVSIVLTDKKKLVQIRKLILIGQKNDGNSLIDFFYVGTTIYYY